MAPGVFWQHEATRWGRSLRSRPAQPSSAGVASACPCRRITINGDAVGVVWVGIGVGVGVGESAGAAVGAGESVGVGESAGAAVGAGESVGVGESVGAGELVGAGESVGAGELVGADESVGAGELVGAGESVGVAAAQDPRVILLVSIVRRRLGECTTVQQRGACIERDRRQSEDVS